MKYFLLSALNLLLISFNKGHHILVLWETEKKMHEQFWILISSSFVSFLGTFQHKVQFQWEVQLALTCQSVCIRMLGSSVDEGRMEWSGVYCYRGSA